MKQTYTRVATIRRVKEKTAEEVALARKAEKRNLEHLADMAADEELALSIVGAQKHRMYGSMYYGRASFTVHLSVKSLKHDRKLNNMLARAGTLEAKTEDWVTEYSKQREFNFKLPHGGSLRIIADVAEDSPTCRKVEVAKHIEERIEYALICD